MELTKGIGTALVCPLGWGLGHASRVIPIIKYLHTQGWKVIIAGDSSSISLINSEIPDLKTVFFPSIPAKLSKNSYQGFKLISIALRLVFWTIKEHNQLEPLIKEHGVNLVISDNRYGLYSDRVPCVLVTHQLRILFPFPFQWIQPLGRWYVGLHAKRFTECWIPDNPTGFKLTGILSDNLKGLSTAKRIGLLSRFSGITIAGGGQHWGIVVIVSGPEPQRALFEEAGIALAQIIGVTTLVVRGLPEESEKETQIGSVTLVPHLAAEPLAKALLNTERIVCRAGYSTIMDLVALHRSALLVPTPGQTEQEYLAKRLNDKGLFMSCRQDKLVSTGMEKLDACWRELPEGIGKFSDSFFPPRNMC